MIATLPKLFAAVGQLLPDIVHHIYEIVRHAHSSPKGFEPK